MANPESDAREHSKRITSWLLEGRKKSTSGVGTVPASNHDDSLEEARALSAGLTQWLLGSRSGSN